MTTKLNSMRVLEAQNIPYEVLSYNSSTRDAEEVAELLGLPPFMVYKTLVVQSASDSSKKPYLAMLPCDKQLDLKRMADACGEKKIRMATHADAERLTGLQVGGISALMLLDKKWQLYLDRSASELQNLVLSAGQRGLQLRVPVLAFITLTRARLVDIATDKA